jgi:di/tricarboxylate transporter
MYQLYTVYFLFVLIIALFILIFNQKHKKGAFCWNFVIFIVVMISFVKFISRVKLQVFAWIVRSILKLVLPVLFIAPAFIAIMKGEMKNDF